MRKGKAKAFVLLDDMAFNSCQYIVERLNSKRVTRMVAMDIFITL